jgi:hypothetical protein
LRTLSDARTERRALDAVWDDVLQFMLEQGMWNFAGRSIIWEPSSTVVPEFGQRYAFEKPVDYVRLIRISDNETLEPTLAGYLEEGDFFISDCSIIYAQYVSNDINWGADPGKWPPTFSAAFQAELAYRGRGGVKSLSANDVVLLDKTKKTLLQNAQSKDAVNQAPTELPTGRLVRSRGGFRGNDRMRRTPYA